MARFLGGHWDPALHVGTGLGCRWREEGVVDLFAFLILRGLRGLDVRADDVVDLRSRGGGGGGWRVGLGDGRR